MINYHFPTMWIKGDWASQIRADAAKAAIIGNLTDVQTEIMHTANWLKSLVPAAYGGLELPLPQMLQLEEELSCVDGSMGWVLTLCAGAGWFGGLMDPTFAQQIFKDPKCCIAGNGALCGVAEKRGNKYLINGTWPYATGAPEATVFTLSCRVTENGIDLKDDKNIPLVLSFALLKDEVVVLPSWNSTGMVATASHSFEVKNIMVGQDRCFRIDKAGIKIQSPLYHYPFLQLAEATLAANMSGMAIHFHMLCTRLLSEKKDRNGELLIRNRQVSSEVEKQQLRFKGARASLYDCVQTSWKECAEKLTVSKEALENVSYSAHIFARIALQSVDAIYPFCGVSATSKDSEINRVWLDLHTAGQHPLLVFDH
jgi:alkylation response protein AidB-like acyl-CoA dehydrogenase